MIFHVAFTIFLNVLSHICVPVVGFHVFPSLLTALTNVHDESCRSQVQDFENSLEASAMWAVRMWDASAKQPTGWLYGNQAQFGNFDECMTITAPFALQFCLARIHFVVSKTEGNVSSVDKYIQKTTADRSLMSRSAAWLGICVPASCNASSITAAVGHHYNNSNQFFWNVSVKQEFCTIANVKPDISWDEILFWSVSVLMVLAVVGATCLDVLITSTGSKWKIVQWISLRSNFNALVAPVTNPEHPLSILHGLRVVSVTVVLYAHRLGIPLSFSAFNHETWEQTLRDTVFQFSAQADMTVDTFFFLSGVLMSYFNRSPKAFYAIILRIFRLIPLYLWVIWLVVSVLPGLGTGPLWNAVQVEESALCAKNWWLNALFLQNYVRDSEMCLTHTWFIACEFHFFLLSLLLLLPLVYWYKPIGMHLIKAVTALALIIPAITSNFGHLAPLVLFYFPEFLANPRGSGTFLETYAKSHNRAAPYMIGILAGFYLASSENSLDKHNLRRSLGWLLMSLLLLFIPMMYGVHFYNPKTVWYWWDVVPFAALRRPAWAVGLLCLILAHRARALPIIGDVLSCRAAAVLSRLSYGVYLIHFPIIMANMAKLRAPPVFNWFDVIFSGDLASSFIFSAMMYLFIEMPVKRTLVGVVFPIKPEPEPNNQNMASSTV